MFQLTCHQTPWLILSHKGTTVLFQITIQPTYAAQAKKKYTALDLCTGQMPWFSWFWTWLQSASIVREIKCQIHPNNFALILAHRRAPYLTIVIITDNDADESIPRSPILWTWSTSLWGLTGRSCLPLKTGLFLVSPLLVATLSLPSVPELTLFS